MSEILSLNALAAAEVCFLEASRLLYCEPACKEIADQVLTRQFLTAPFGMNDSFVTEGLAQMDSWCAETLKCVDANEADTASDKNADDLAADVRFCERVDSLRREWLRLFAGVGTPEASCLESFYVEPNSHMFAKNTLQVREAYRAYGLQIEKLHSEPDDHLGLMLGFVSHMIGAEVEAREAGDDARADAAARDQDVFLAGHVLPWLATWRYNVEKHATSDYYRGVGNFVFGLLACYVRRFGVVFDEKGQRFKRKVD